MLLVHRSRRAATAVRTTSPGGELFVASVVVTMLLAAFGDAVDPVWLEEIGVEFALFDLGGELSLLGMQQWHLLQFLLAGAAIAGGIIGIASPTLYAITVRLIGKRWPDLRDLLSQDVRE